MEDRIDFMSEQKFDLKKSKHFSVLMAVFSLVAIGSIATVWTLSQPDNVQAATCFAIDGGTNDDDASADGTITISSTVNVAASATVYDCTVTSNFHITGTGSLVLGSDLATGDIAEINFTNLTIDSGGSISADEKGCLGVSNGNGKGPNTSNICANSAGGWGNKASFGGGGGSYGGAGGSSSSSIFGGGVYDFSTIPTLFGSSGGGNNGGVIGGSGGGVVDINISGTLDNDGTISSNGGNGSAHTEYSAGGGSGGSVFVDAGTIDGSGVFEAIGGDATVSADTGKNGSGGGGGRVVVRYDAKATGFSGPSSSIFDVGGGAADSPNTKNGSNGTVLVWDDDADSSIDSGDDLYIYYGFTYTDTDYNVNSWTFDTTATNQYCAKNFSGGTETPSITTATNFSFNGTLDCSTGVTSFASFGISAPSVSFASNSSFTTDSNLTITGSSGSVVFNSDTTLSVPESSGNGNLTITPTTSLSIGNGTSISANKTGATIDMTVPDNQVWDNVSITSGAEGGFDIDDAVSITLDDTNGGTVINSNINWSNLVNLTIDSGGSISADEKGCLGVSNADGKGPNSSNICTAGAGGWGSDGDYGGGGGSYGGAGGRGGNGTSFSIYGGGVYGSKTSPSLFGSSGGGDNGGTLGGSGGGLIIISASGTLKLEGGLSVDGGDGGGTIYGIGGGSGGSINIEADTLTCSSGTFSANGGDGGGDGSGTYPHFGGGAGGGRIYASYDTDNSSGSCALSSLTASSITEGGDGGPAGNTDTAEDGSIGTVYFVHVTEDSNTNISDVLSGGPLKAGDTNVVHTIQLTLGNPLPVGTTITATFPAGFTVTGAPTSTASSGLGTSPTFGYTSTTMTATCGTGGCPAGTIVIGGGEATNPSTPGIYQVEITNDYNSDTGSVAIPIIDDDQVTITAQVGTTLTFDIDTPTSNSCSETSASYSMGFDAISSSSVQVSGAIDGVEIICLDLASNASGGAIVTVTSENGSLLSASTDAIVSADGTMAAGTEKYGLCISSLGTGLTAGLSDTSCAVNTETNTVTGLTGGLQTVISRTSPIVSGTTMILGNAAVSSITPAHSDYTDSLTFIATSTF